MIKTLKDLGGKKFGNSIYAHYSEKELKQEVIKHIKLLSSENESCYVNTGIEFDGHGAHLCEFCDENDAICSWIKNFFNIYEKDLK